MTPSSNQLHFLALHVLHNVERWKWHWANCVLRATTDRRRTATLWADEVSGLVEAGLMSRGVGEQMVPTEAGVALVRGMGRAVELV